MSSIVQLLGEELISLAAAAAMIPAHHGARTASSTVFRWLTRGVKVPGGGILRLEGLRLAGRWLTTREAVQRFLLAQHEAHGPHATSPMPDLPRTLAQRQRAAQRADAQLKVRGI
jgi:hypothetical protein